MAEPKESQTSGENKHKLAESINFLFVKTKYLSKVTSNRNIQPKAKQTCSEEGMGILPIQWK